MEDLENETGIYCTICKTQIDRVIPNAKYDKSNISVDITKHKDWCAPVGKAIERRFKGTFRDIYNVLELSVNEDKVSIVKELIGDEINKTQHDCINFIADYFLAKEKV